MGCNGIFDMGGDFLKRIVIGVLLLSNWFIVTACSSELEPTQEDLTFEELVAEADLAVFVKWPEKNDEAVLEVERAVYGPFTMDGIELANAPEELMQGSSYLLFLEKNGEGNAYEILSPSGIIEYDPNKAIYETELLKGDGEYHTHELAELIAGERAEL